MVLILSCPAILVLSGVFAVILSGSPTWSTRAAVGGSVVGSACGIAACVQMFVTAEPVAFRIPWSIPTGAFELYLDPLAALFLVPILLLGALSALYGVGYLRGNSETTKVGVSWFYYNLLLAAMAVVVMAHNALLFLIAWETMALTSLMLVLFDNRRTHVRRAGWIYMTATHLGAAFLLVLFALLGEKAGSFDFGAFTNAGAALPSTLASVGFVFALIGFGSKAGFMPIHIWLPEAHPAAPSYASALMSGAMIKTGIYGLLRVLSFFGNPPVWWGWCLLTVGIVSGVLGVLFAVAQQDIKRLLAYSSVENIGIITIGIGLGYIGLAYGNPAAACLGFAGALLHVLNHAFFKGLLFLGAGSVLHATGTADMDHLGGLLKRMPITGVTFLIGSAAICGLPPLNGFISEFLIYLGAFKGVTSTPGALAVASACALAALALIGGLAAVCFTKVFGIVFLGEARSDHGRHAHEAHVGMLAPMTALAAGCILIGALAPWVITYGIFPAVRVLMYGVPESVQQHLAASVASLSWVIVMSVLLALLIITLTVLRASLLSRRRVRESVTWDCGYAQPESRMQYTGSSYAQPVTAFFEPVLKPQRTYVKPAGILAGPASFATETKDLFLNKFYAPFLERTTVVLEWFRQAQHGRLHLYVLYIALTLLVLLIFGIR